MSGYFGTITFLYSFQGLSKQGGGAILYVYLRVLARVCAGVCKLRCYWFLFFSWLCRVVSVSIIVMSFWEGLGVCCAFVVL